jgi:hypothetical protein
MVRITKCGRGRWLLSSAARVEAILESEKYETLTVDELFSKLKSSKVDRGVSAKIENATNPHSLALVSGSRTNANMSLRHFSLYSLVSLLDEDFDVLGEDNLALLWRRFERMYENLMSSRRNMRTCFKCGKTRHFFAECPKLDDNNKHKSKDKRRKSKKNDHGHGRKSSDVESDSKDTSSTRVMKKNRETTRRRTSVSTSTVFV